MNNLDMTIEDLVSLRAEKSILDTKVKELEAKLKTNGIGSYSSHYHTVNIIEVNSNPVNWKALALNLKPSKFLMKKHTGKRTSIRLTISAKIKKVA